jgi:hypothetical protein
VSVSEFELAPRVAARVPELEISLASRVHARWALPHEHRRRHVGRRRESEDCLVEERVDARRRLSHVDEVLLLAVDEDRSGARPRCVEECHAGPEDLLLLSRDHRVEVFDLVDRLRDATEHEALA